MKQVPRYSQQRILAKNAGHLVTGRVTVLWTLIV